jgi:peptide/nickel transport system substrate-binding protein
MHRADFDALVEKAVTTTDPATRKRVLFAAQKILRDQGGYIVWGYADEIDLARSNVHGLPTAAGKARYSLWRTWLSK